MVPTDKTAAQTKKNQFAQASQDIWRILPHVEDFDRLKYVLRPYVMRMPIANHRSPSLTTDEHGFRRLVVGDETLGFDQFCAAPGKKGVLLGDSTIFGYGLAENETLQAQLSQRSDGATL